MLGKLKFSVVRILSGMFAGILGISWVGAAQLVITSSDPKGQIYTPWPMHHVCRDFLIANSLNAADVDGDGFNDYSVIDERRDLMTIVFRPGKNGDVRKEWPRLVLGQTGNPEYACLGDLDGDGNIDMVVVEGDDLGKGLRPGVRVIWGPAKAKAHDASAWHDGGLIPGTDNEQYVYAECHDVDADGTVDIIVGGRRHPVTRHYAGLRWLKGPTDPKQRRDLSKWTTHFIDPDCQGGHGFVFADVDLDGRQDLLLANADWDTSIFDRDLCWYENPGPGPVQLKPWPRQRIWKSTEFHPKPQIGIADYDSDGLPDLVTQTQNSLHLFRRQTKEPAAWQRITIPKPDFIQWIGRPVKFADLNGDGRPDIVGALIHNDGNLPKDKASVFWLENNGGSPETWKAYPIKWSDGANTRDQWIGEKWDHLIPVDVDGDGDLDLLGNVEEHFHKGPDGKDVSWFSVVWFESPLNRGFQYDLSQLRVSANHRYLEDTSGRPFFLMGDCPQNLPLKLAIPELDDYLADCEQKGFNLLWICMDGQRTASPTSKPPQDPRGVLMMSNGWQIGSLNPEYFLTIDAIVDKAKTHNIYCMFTPLCECQWSQANINLNGPDEWYNYGKFLGARYKRQANILWQLGNDTINETAQHKIVQGIKDAGDTHLMTVNWRPGHYREGSGWMRKYEHGERWIDLNAWYMNAPVAEGGAPCYWQKIEYERPNPMPSFPTETQYQKPYAKATDLECRMQNYYTALGGGCGGQVYGSGWLADNWDYASYRDNGGRMQAVHFMNLFRPREWWSLVPDCGHSFVTSGYGTLSPTTMDYVGAAINSAGTLGMAYCPKEAAITADLSLFSGPVIARWYDPTDGTFRSITVSPFSHTGTQRFRTPGANRAGDYDRVLVLEASP